MNPIFKKGDIITPIELGYLKFPAGMQQLTVFDVYPHHDLYIIKDRNGEYSSVPFYLLHSNYKEKRPETVF